MGKPAVAIELTGAERAELAGYLPCAPLRSHS